MLRFWLAPKRTRQKTETLCISDSGFRKVDRPSRASLVANRDGDREERGMGFWEGKHRKLFLLPL